MIAKYLLLATLVTYCWADPVPESLSSDKDDPIPIVSGNPLLNTNLRTSTPKNPYATVGKCDKLLKKALPGFDINQLANTAIYNYVYSTSLDNADCATGSIYGDDEIGFRGTASVVQNRKPTNFLYDLSPNDDGTIDETLTLDDDSEYNFKLVPLALDSKTGVFYYARCSNEGLSKSDSRSIVINQCNSRSIKARKIAEAFAKRDSLAGFEGDNLSKVKQCPK
uniref:Lipocalin/cytosolic fatty-acid binding domain-containing protein n=1 Tax=Clastoptera arizonana TaxID=38151 RepID=A0A1B6BYA5_9HEMI